MGQSIGGFVSGVYTLTFSAAQRSNILGAEDFAVRLDGITLGTFKPAGRRYEDFGLSFNTRPGTHNLEFVGLNTGHGDNTTFIDNVGLVLDHATSVIDGGGELLSQRVSSPPLDVEALDNSSLLSSDVATPRAAARPV